MRRFESDREKQRKILQENVKLILAGLREIGYTINSQTHIIPIIIGDEKTAMDFGRYLFKNGVYAQPIRYPTVPKDQARIRLSVTAWLSCKDIENSLDVFERAYKKFMK